MRARTRTKADGEGGAHRVHVVNMAISRPVCAAPIFLTQLPNAEPSSQFGEVELFLQCGTRQTVCGKQFQTAFDAV